MRKKNVQKLSGKEEGDRGNVHSQFLVEIWGLFYNHTPEFSFSDCKIKDLCKLGPNLPLLFYYFDENLGAE